MSHSITQTDVFGMSFMITFDLGREDFTDQHPWDGTETEREQDDEHAHGCEWNETNG